VESGVKDEKPLALRTWSLNGGVIRIQLTRLADFADGDAIHGAIHAFTKALAGSRAPSDAALVEALEERVELLQSALLEIAEKDWHARTPPKPRADGGMRGWAGHLAVWALTGLHGSYSGDDAVRAALAAAKGQQP